MSKTRRSFTSEFKLQVVTEARAGATIAELARRYELSPSVIRRWRTSLEGTPSPQKAFPGNGSRATDKAKQAAMERLIARQALEIDFLKNALARMKGEEV